MKFPYREKPHSTGWKLGKVSRYMDLTEEQDIKKTWQEYTEGLYKKDLHDPDNYDGVSTSWS